MKEKARLFDKWLVPLLLLIGAFALYRLTLAPSVLWGDAAWYQRTAWENTLKADGGGHWLWLRLARVFLRLPWGDPAFRTNLLSAVLGAATIPVVYGAAKAFGQSTRAAVLSALALAISHTFWTVSVITEVYTVFMFLLAVELWLWALWKEERSYPVVLAAFLWGLCILAHQMAVLFLPAFAYLLWLRRKWLNQRILVWLVCAGLAGLGLMLLVLSYQIPGVNLVTVLVRYFTRSSEDFAGKLFDFNVRSLGRDFVMWLAYTGMQFVSPAGVLVGVAAVAGVSKRLPPAWRLLLVAYVVSVAFAFSYHINEQYAFYLPSYLALCLWVGFGWDHLANRLSHTPYLYVFCAILCILMPVATYYAAPAFIESRGLNPMDIRELPGRPAYRYFLWPPKHWVTGARHYGEAALDVLPENAVLFVDYTPAETLNYLQIVEGKRPDVELRYIGLLHNLEGLINNGLSDRDVYIYDDSPNYYPLGTLESWQVEPYNRLFHVTR